jgi:hypothetical protein
MASGANRQQQQRGTEALGARPAATGSRRFGLRPQERAAWEADGFFLRPAALAPAELDELRAAAESVAAIAARACIGPVDRDYRVDGNRYVDTLRATVQFEHRPGSAAIRVVEPFHHLHPRLDALLDDPRLVEPMCDLVGAERVSLWTDKLNLKRPREGSRFRFHQDSPYWAHCCPHVERLPNVMVALDDAHRGNGCLRVVRGSHRLGLLPGIQDETTLGPLFTDPRSFEGREQVLAEMPAGSLFFFHPHTVHGSEPNLSEEPRRALVITYQPPDLPMFKLEAVRNASPSSA